jgi:hypothetical protein
MSYIILRGLWSDIFMNVHASDGSKSDHIKDSFYKELVCLKNTQRTSSSSFLFELFSTGIWREDIFKPTARNESLHKISINDGVRVVYVDT